MFFRTLLLIGHCLASVDVYDPSDFISSAPWTADNALGVDYSVAPPATQPTDLLSVYTYSGSDNVTELDRVTLSATENNTNVILVADGAALNLSYSELDKSGYSSNLLWASFYGFNAAINIANASTGHLKNVNITTHNGAANVYVYGTDSVVTVDGAFLYSSGPVAHGVYASGNGTAYVSHISHYSGGERSSAFSGDSPAGYLYISDSVSHTAGVGSATFYALGEIHANDVVGHSDNGPSLFMDGYQTAVIDNSDLTAGLLGGIVIFSSMVLQSGGYISISNSKLTTLGADMPGLWFGNINKTVSLTNTEIITASGILAVANYSQITQDFDYYAGYADNPGLSPATVDINIAESTLVGDIVPYNESTINWNLTQYSSWTGTAYSGFGVAYANIFLDSTSSWKMTNDTTVSKLISDDDSLSNVDSRGFNLYYDSVDYDNAWLDGKTLSLAGGGKVAPL